MNIQPNDDGLSGQDCVELRQQFAPLSSTLIPSFGGGPRTLLPIIIPINADHTSSAELKTKGYKQGFYWNDRNCQTLNPFLCERATHQGKKRTLCILGHVGDSYEIRVQGSTR
jgi:hypothetical protein